MDLSAWILTLQRTDRWVGAPLCAILTFLRRIFEFAGQPGPRQVQRILFVKFAEQGSTVLAYPAILRAIEMVGRENVYFVVFEDNRFILDAMEIIPDGNVITISPKSAFGLAIGALRALLQARKIGIDAVVDMEFLTRFSAILTFYDRRQIARWLSYFLWRRTVPRRPNDAPAFVQSTSSDESDVRSYGCSFDLRPRDPSHV